MLSRTRRLLLCVTCAAMRCMVRIVHRSGRYFVGIRVVSFTKRKWSYHLSMESGQREAPFHPKHGAAWRFAETRQDGSEGSEGYEEESKDENGTYSDGELLLTTASPHMLCGRVRREAGMSNGSEGSVYRPIGTCRVA